METYSLATPAPAPKEEVPPQADEGTPPPTGIKKYTKFLQIGGVILGFLVMFVLGTLVRGGNGTQNQAVVTPTQIPTVTQSAVTNTPSGPVGSSVQYLPGKEYLDDSVAIITKTEPRQVLFISISRFEQERNYTQYAKVNYHNGTSWIRENVTTTIPRSEIINNPLIRRWGISPTTEGNGQSRVDVTVENKALSITLKNLSFDISTKSYPGYTKFSYFGDGTFQSEAGTAEAYVMYTQTYAINAFELSFLSTPEKLDNDWLVFWDEQGNVYHIDTLASDQKNKPFQNYQTAVIYYADGRVTKGVGAKVSTSAQNGRYTATISTQPPVQLTFIPAQLLNKATSKAYTWQTGVISGALVHNSNTVNGVGLMESIHPVKN